MKRYKQTEKVQSACAGSCKQTSSQKMCRRKYVWDAIFGLF